MGKAQQNVNTSMSAMQNIVTTLQQAHASAEKPENKQLLQSAIDSINSTCQQLSNFQD